jgi:adenine-specific DNA-methyltransferase
MAGIDFRGKGLVWAYHHGLPLRALKAAPKRSLGTGGESGNLVVVGNLLESMKALKPRYQGAVDVIYAVPPYNNGVDGWKYDDDIPTPLTQEWLKVGPSGKDDPDRHDKWLAWMTPRVRLMHDLLSENGVLFMSIDDSEGHRLKMLLDEVFQEDNALATLIWEKRYSPPADVKDIGYMHENILVYRKSSNFKPALLPLTNEQVARYKDHTKDKRGKWKAADYTCRWTKEERPNLYYGIVNPYTKEEVFPKPTRVWAYSKEETKKNIADDLLWWGAKGQNSVPALKNFATGIQQGMVPTSLLKWEDAGHTDQAAKELRALLPDVKRDSKPLLLLKYLFDIAGKDGGLVLFPFPSAGEGPQSIIERNALCKSPNKPTKFISIVSDDESESILTRRLKAISDSGIAVDFELYKLGSPVDGDSLLRAKDLPGFDEIARHVFWSATGVSLVHPPKLADDWFIGSHNNVDIYLIYKPDKEFLRSNKAILDEDVALKILKSRKEGHSSVIFASGKYLSLEYLLANKLEFSPFPVSIYRSLGE